MGGTTKLTRWRGRMRLPQGRTRSAAALVGGPGPGAQDHDAAAPPAGAAFPPAGRRDPAPRVAALLTLAAGVLNLGSALLPAERQRLDLLHRLVPGAVSRGATVVTAAAGVGLILAGLLAGQGSRFKAGAGPSERRATAVAGLGVIGITTAYGTVGLLANGRDVAEDLGAARVLREVARIALGLGSSLTLTGRFGRFFPTSVAAVFWLGVLVVAARALAPALARWQAHPGLSAAVAGADDSLAYFALRDDRATVRAAHTKVWAAAGLTTLYLGDEAILDLRRFSLEGRAVRIAQQSWNRARRAGFTTLACHPGDLDPDSVSALRELSRRWRGQTAERGFSMALGRLFDPRDSGAMVVVARDATGRPVGFLYLVPWGADGASLDVMRRDRDSPGYLNDFLVVEAARRLPELGVERLSMNFSFLRAVVAAGAEPDVPLGLRGARWLLHRLSSPFQIETLYRFNKKFAPAWQPRYLAVEAPEELPRVVIAVLRAEGLLPAVPWRLTLLRSHQSAGREEALPKPPPEPPAPMPDRR